MYMNGIARQAEPGIRIKILTPQGGRGDRANFFSALELFKNINSDDQTMYFQEPALSKRGLYLDLRNVEVHSILATRSEISLPIAASHVSARSQSIHFCSGGQGWCSEPAISCTLRLLRIWRG